MGKLTVWVLPLFLLGCSGSGNDNDNEFSLTLAELLSGTLTITENDQDSSVFISDLDLEVDPTNLSQLSFTIVPKREAVAQAISATFDIDKLVTTDDVVKLPIWGMYDDFENTVNVTLHFIDGSEKIVSHNVLTEPYLDPDSLYDQIVINKSINATSEIKHSYIFLESNARQGPVIMDIDGYIRWVTNNPAGPSGGLDLLPFEYMSAKFDDGEIVMHLDGNLLKLRLSGEKTVSPIEAIGLTNILSHHEIEKGKYGYILNIDATKNEKSIIEAILLEVDSDGNYIDHWDFGEIIANHMLENLEDPTALVRDGIDWFHMNSAIYDPSDDSIIVSARELFVMKVAYSTKEIKWILGDETKYWAEFPSLLAMSLYSSDIKPMGQHALSITGGQLMMFNNGQASFNQPEGEAAGEVLSTSLAMKWEIDEINMEAKNTWSYDAGIYSDVCSSAYEQDGSYLVTYGSVNRRTSLKNKIIIQGLDTEKNVSYEFEHLGFCSSWSGEIIRLESLVYAD